MTYIEKLKDPRWQRKRLEIMQRDEFTCQSCFCSDATLHVHHALYSKGKDPWDYNNSDLITLCKDCHEVAEKFRDDILRMSINPSSAELLWHLLCIDSEIGSEFLSVVLCRFNPKIKISSIGQAKAQLRGLNKFRATLDGQIDFLTQYIEGENGVDQ